MTLRRKVGLVISLAAFAISIHTLPPLVTYFSDRFALSPQLFGVVFLLQSLSFTLCAMGIGNLHRKRDLPLVTIVLTALFIASALLFFIGFTPSFSLLILMMIVIGGSGGLVESVGTTLLSEDSKSQKLLHLSQFFFAVGAFSAPLIVGLFLKVGLKVPQIGMAVGAFALVVATVVLFLITGNSKVSAAAPAEEAPPATTNEAKNGFIWLFLTIMTYVILENSLASWLPVYLETTFAFNSANASLTLTCFWVGLSITRLAFVFLKNYSTKKSILIYTLLLFISSILFLLLRVTSPTWLVMGVVTLVGLACGPIWVLIVENSRERFSGGHLVMYLVGAGSLGGLIGPLLTSFIFSLTSIAYLGSIQIVYGVIFTVLTILALKTKREAGNID